jgi:hypothetical protein
MDKRVFGGHPGGRKKTVRPRKQRLDDIEEDLKLMEVKREKIKTTEKDDWAKFAWKAKALHGL